MTFSTHIRRITIAAALAATTLSAVALPSTVHADVSVASRAGRADFGRTRADDPLAEQAANALAMLDRMGVSAGSSAIDAYEQARDQIAAATAGRAEVDAASMQQAWAAADIEHQRALLGALSQLGVPYRRNTSRPGVGFDCSGLTTYAWSKSGIELVRQSTRQIRAAQPRTAETAQPGDLVQYPGHIMMWLGVDRAVVHSPQSGRTVEIDQYASRRSVKFGDPTS